MTNDTERGGESVVGSAGTSATPTPVPAAEEKDALSLSACKGSGGAPEPTPDLREAAEDLLGYVRVSPTIIGPAAAIVNLDKIEALRAALSTPSPEPTPNKGLRELRECRLLADLEAASEASHLAYLRWAVPRMGDNRDESWTTFARAMEKEAAIYERLREVRRWPDEEVTDA